MWLLSLKIEDAEKYNSWGQVGGYYDGDGCVIVRIRQYVLIFYLEWVDHCREQLAQVDDFLHLRANISSRIYRIPTLDAYHLRVTRQASVIGIVEKMIPYTYKKRTELQLVVDYYANRITGNQAISLINAQIRKGFRSADYLSADLPLTHVEAVRRARRRSGLSDADIVAILREHEVGVPISELARVYRKTFPTIRKIVADASVD